MPPVDQRYFKKADESIDQYNTRVSGFQTINSAALSPEKPFVPAVAEESPIPDVSSLNADVSDLFAPTQQEQDFTSSRSRISDLTQQLSGIAPRRAELEVQEDVAGKKRLVQDLSSQLASLQAEAKTIPLQVQQQFEGQGATRGGIAPHETARLRENAIKTLPIAAQLEAARGNLSMAIDLVDRAVNAEFDPIQKKLDAEMANLDLILKDPAATREQQKRAEILLQKKEAEKQAAAVDAENRKTIQGLALQAQENGAPAAIVSQIMRAKDLESAIMATGGWGKKETDSEIRRYNEAKNTGFKGSFLDYQKELERAKLLGKAPSSVKASIPSVVNGSGQYKSDLDAMVGNTFNLITSKFGQESFADAIKRARNDSDKLTAIATIALGKASSDERKDFVSQAQGVKSIEKAISMLDEGLKTGRLEQGTQYLYNLAGDDYDPKLAQLNQYITSAIQPYRSSITGAAWGEQEDAEYKQLFGSSGYTPEALKTRLLGLKDILTSKSATALQAYVSPLGVFGGETNQFAKEMNDPYGTYRSQLGSDEILVNRNGRMMAVTQDELLETDEQL